MLTVLLSQAVAVVVVAVVEDAMLCVICFSV